MNLKFAFDFATERFKKKNLDNPELEARWLVSGVLNVPETAIWSDSKLKLTKEQILKLSETIEERIGGRPLAYVLGQKDFYGRTFEVTPDVLIPRPETELIIEVVLKFFSQNQSRSLTESRLHICDMGTGSGCVGLTLLAELPKATLVTVDISPAAQEVAKRNAAKLGVAERASIIFGGVALKNFKSGSSESATDQASSFEYAPSFDVVVANPPYIAQDDPEVEAHVRKYEPHLALFAPENGLKLIYDWMKVTAQILKPGGLFVYEIGRNQADSVRNFIDNLKSFQDIRVIKDLGGHDRIITGIRL